ncbi:MAG: PHB depolymerase family esterase [Bacteroidota bacterium]
MKNIPFLALIIFAVACTTGCHKSGRNDYTLNINGDTREYIVYVPTHYTPGTDYPLVCMLHGSSGTGERFYNISGWNDVAESDSFLVVYPTSWAYDIQDNNCNGTLVTRWMDYIGSTTICDPTEERDDVAFIDSMLDVVQAVFSVDQDRIYMAGFSSGGNMTARLSVELSDRLAASGIVAGTLPADTIFAPIGNPAIQVVVGNQDPGIVDQTIFTDSLPMNFATLFTDPLFQGIINTYQQSFNLNSTYTVNGDSTAFLHARFNATSGNHYLRMTLVQGLQHRFPNPGGATALWSFFKNKTL